MADRIEYRPTPGLTEDLEARAGHMSIDLIARRDVERYYTVVRDELRALTLKEAEASLICDAMNGVWMDEHAVRFVWAEVADAIRLNGLGEKWKVTDGAGLVERLRTMTPGQRMALVDAVERFWLRPEVPTGEGLRQVGLVRE